MTTRHDQLFRSYIEGDLSPWERVELHDLLTHDAHARERFLRLRQVSRAVPALVGAGSERFIGGVMDTIEADHRQYASRVMRQIRLVPEQRSRLAWLGTAAAAAAVILGLGGLARIDKPARVNQPTDGNSESGVFRLPLL